MFDLSDDEIAEKIATGPYVAVLPQRAAETFVLSVSAVCVHTTQMRAAELRSYHAPLGVCWCCRETINDLSIRFALSCEVQQAYRRERGD